MTVLKIKPRIKMIPDLLPLPRPKLPSRHHTQTTKARVLPIEHRETLDRT